MPASGPPARLPFHFEPVWGEDHVVTPSETFGTMAGRLETSLKPGGVWRVGPWRFELVDLPRAAPDRLDAAFRAWRDDASGHSVPVSLAISVHPSGWIEAAVNVGGGAPFLFYVERVYEEFDIWPAGSGCSVEETGRMGKRCSWVQLKAGEWPELAALVEDGFITVEGLDPGR